MKASLSSLFLLSPYPSPFCVSLPRFSQCLFNLSSRSVYTPCFQVFQFYEFREFHESHILSKFPIISLSILFPHIQGKQAHLKSVFPPGCTAPGENVPAFIFIIFLIISLQVFFSNCDFAPNYTLLYIERKEIRSKKGVKKCVNKDINIGTLPKPVMGIFRLSNLIFGQS